MPPSIENDAIVEIPSRFFLHVVQKQPAIAHANTSEKIIQNTRNPNEKEKYIGDD